MTILEEPPVVVEPVVREPVPTYPYLLLACDVIDQLGWTTDIGTDGPVCILQACAIAHGGRHEDWIIFESDYPQEHEALLVTLDYDPVGWNDTAAQDANQVKNALREAAYYR